MTHVWEKLSEDVLSAQQEMRREFGGDDVEAAGRAISKLTEEAVVGLSRTARG